MTTQIFNAQIENTFLGIEDHGILTFNINLLFADYEQNFGGYALDVFDKEKNKRIGHHICADMILNILKTLEFNSWEELRGKYLRIVKDIHSDKIISIGHITKDQWFDVQQLINEVKNG
jgi:hypothetical protein